MASGSIGELPKKSKWSENCKVYSRKTPRNPKGSNSTSSTDKSIPVSNNELVDKKSVETSCRIAVESNGANKNGVNGTVSNDIGNKLGKVVEEVLNSENRIEKVPTTTGNDVEKNSEIDVEDVPSCENVVEDVPRRENLVEEMASNGNVEKEVPDNGNANRIEEVSDDVNNTVKVPNNVKDNEQVHNSDKHVEEVCSSEHGADELPNNESIVEKAPKQNNVDDVPQKDNIADEAPYNVNNVEEVPPNENIVEEAPCNVTDIDEEMPEQSSSPKQPIEEANLAVPLQNPPHVETIMVSDHSLNRNRVEERLPNGHDQDDNLGNGVVREEDVIEEEPEEQEEEEGGGGEERPMVTLFDDRLNISVTAAKSVEEVRDLKRKLEGELVQVRKMARKLEAKETQLITSMSFDSGRLNDAPPPPPPPVIRRLHIPVNGGMKNSNISMRPTQELGSVSYSHPRSFGELSVSVMDNSYQGLGEIPLEKEKRTPKANQYYRNSDFLLGKEKLPPAENNRRAKSSGGGKKHGKGEFEVGLGFDKKINKKCSELLQKLRNHKHGWVFNQPVDVKRLGLHDYFDIIQHPMDLGTVKTRLTNHWYKTPREFAEDVRLTFHNAMTYNPAGQDVHIMAKELLRIFEEKWPPIEADYDRRLRYEMFRDLGTPTPTSRRLYDPPHPPIQHMPLPPPPILRAPPTFQETRNLDRSQSMPVRPESRPKPIPSVRTPAPKKPKAKDLNKRDMTFDEKQKLSTNLQGLPSEKLDVIVQIIKKRNTALSQHDDEIEVDIDSVDTETLWELDRFVTNFKKSLSKHKRKAELAAEARARTAAATAAQPIPVTAPPAPPVVEAPRETRADEGNIATEPPAQQERQNDNNASDSSSSSSSSSSGSSSSDSDSSSSSDSGSDEER